MAVLRVEFDNILCFKKFKADFTYPKKIVNSSIENEYFLDYPNVRYKKVNIIIGSNASGKTSLGKAIWQTMIFITQREANPLRNIINDIGEDAYILMDCAFRKGLFFRFECKLLASGETLVRYREIHMQKEDTYKSIVDRLDDTIGFKNYIEALEESSSFGWNFNFPSIEAGCENLICDYEDKNKFLDVLETVLKAFDPSVEKVFISREQENTYIIKFYDGNTQQVKNGDKISHLMFLSSGTKYAVNIAGLIYSIMNHNNGFYFVDEQFSYANSDLEIACLTTMVHLLADGEQLFITTHNTELLSLPFPNHTFSFIRKKQTGKKSVITMDDASLYEKRNNVNIKNLYDNGFFNATPDVNKIYGVIK